MEQKVPKTNNEKGRECRPTSASSDLTADNREIARRYAEVKPPRRKLKLLLIAMMMTKHRRKEEQRRREIRTSSGPQAIFSLLRLEIPLIRQKRSPCLV